MAKGARDEIQATPISMMPRDVEAKVERLQRAVSGYDSNINTEADIVSDAFNSMNSSFTVLESDVTNKAGVVRDQLPYELSHALADMSFCTLWPSMKDGSYRFHQHISKMMNNGDT